MSPGVGHQEVDSAPRPCKVLILVLKRLSGFTGDKMHKQVRYPGCLDVLLYISEQKVGHLDYVLYAVLVHSGKSCHQGHYFCCIRAGNGQWYKMDDAKVTPCAMHLPRVPMSSLHPEE